MLHLALFSALNDLGFDIAENRLFLVLLQSLFGPLLSELPGITLLIVTLLDVVVLQRLLDARLHDMLFVMLGLLRVLVVKLRELGAVCCPLVSLFSDLQLRHLLLPQHLLLFLLLLSILQVLAALDVPPQIVEVV